MPASEGAGPDVYSSWVGLIYVFNLIVGTGALTLPSAFAKAGWLLSTVLLVGIAFFSFITVTFIIETLACANATIQLKRLQSHKIDGESEAAIDSESSEEEEVTNEETAIIASNRKNMRRYYSLNQQVELGEMAKLYFCKSGRALFYISLCVYLYGDLAIYATAVSKSVCDLFCPHNNTNNNNNSSLVDFRNDSNPDDFTVKCFGGGITKLDLYRIFVAVFALLIGPFSYFNVQKTKYFQLATTSMRWFAFTIMITLATVRIIKLGGVDDLEMSNVKNIPVLIGASVYSFMCHHSLPGLIAPFSEKQYIVRQLALDYTLICSFYLLMSITGIFAFKNVDDLYTLNFVPSSDDAGGFFSELILYFLGMFPIFTLSTSFPIIAITLQNNLKTLFLDPNKMDRYNFVLKRLTFPTLAIAPPIVVALCTHNLGSLVEFTGSYAGACIQYIIPAMLVLQARKHCSEQIGTGVRNKYTSPFRGNLWIYFIVTWSLVSVVFVTINLFS